MVFSFDSGFRDNYTHDKKTDYGERTLALAVNRFLWFFGEHGQAFAGERGGYDIA